ncbi:MAG: PoNe immunity protein domain-containing protein [Fluviicola sp.]
MRDKLKDEKHFNRWVDEFHQSIDRVNNWISTGKTPVERINIMKRSMVQSNINIVLCKYSSNKRINELSKELIDAIKLTHESWDGFWLIKTGEPNGSIVLNQYGLSGYDEMLWMLSLGYLLNIEETEFKKLVEVIDRDGVKDFLFEFIIRAKLNDRQPIAEESYQVFFGIPQTYQKLRQAITETDKTKAEKLVKEFITKDWYKNHKEAGWYNSHKSKHDTYFGYWSFETAAVVKIMGLDDSSFRDCQYYSKDLVNF